MAKCRRNSNSKSNGTTLGIERLSSGTPRVLVSYDRLTKNEIKTLVVKNR